MIVDLYGLYIAVVLLWRFIIRPLVVPLLFGTSYSLAILRRGRQPERTFRVLGKYFLPDFYTTRL